MSDAGDVAVAVLMELRLLARQLPIHTFRNRLVIQIDEVNL